MKTSIVRTLLVTVCIATLVLPSDVASARGGRGGGFGGGGGGMRMGGGGMARPSMPSGGMNVIVVATALRPKATR